MPLSTYAERFGYVNALRKSLRDYIDRAAVALKEGQPERAAILLQYAADTDTVCLALHPEVAPSMAETVR